jgi:hypothetical protein
MQSGWQIIRHPLVGFLAMNLKSQEKAVKKENAADPGWKKNPRRLRREARRLPPGNSRLFTDDQRQ